MRRLVLVLMAAAVMPVLLASGRAEAGTTCQLVPDWCPVGEPGGSSSVPEPATLALLTTGLAAAGVAAWRRRKGKND